METYCDYLAEMAFIIPFIGGVSLGGVLLYGGQEKIGSNMERIHDELLMSARKIELRLPCSERNHV